MAISIRLNDDDANLIKKYAALHNMTVSELVRKSVIERIEDKLDLPAYEKAIADYKKNPVTCVKRNVKKRTDISKWSDGISASTSTMTTALPPPVFFQLLIPLLFLPFSCHSKKAALRRLFRQYNAGRPFCKGLPALVDLKQ